jgi:uncharacterized protein YciI
MPMFLVQVSRSGPEYDHSKPMQQQSGWEAHRSFMNDLAAGGFVVIGGPLADGVRVAHAVEAESAAHVEEVLSADPWHGSHLRLDSVEPWSIVLDSR